MSDPITTETSSLAPGQVTFYRACLLPMKLDSYRLVASQTIENIKGEPEAPQFSIQQQFRLAGPRFTLGAGEIHMVYPPANQAGIYHNTLPHVVLSNRSLPWARMIAPDAGDTPWMALLSLHEGDSVPGQPLVAGPPVRLTVEQLLHPDEPDVLPPDLQNVAPDELTQGCLAVDIDLNFFRSIAPLADELPLLAHAREVDTGGKAILGLNEQGFFSVLVGNRLIQAGENTVLLVSLEGHRNHLPDQPPVGGQYRMIRLVCLARWSFTAQPAPGDFLGLLQALELPGRGGIELLQLPNQLADLPTSAGRDQAQAALGMGFVPLENHMRVGEKTTSWYRGPFAPVLSRRDTTYGPYTFSDHAIHYDPDTGLFNLSYAAAWQIGRLLALSDASFARALFNWRRSQQDQAEQRQIAQGLQTRLASTLAFATLPNAPEQSGSTLGQLLLHFWRHNVGLRIQSTDNPVPFVEARERRAERRGLPGVLSEAEVDDLLESGQDPLDLLLQKIVRADA